MKLLFTFEEIGRNNGFVRFRCKGHNIDFSVDIQEFTVDNNPEETESILFYQLCNKNISIEVKR